MENDSVEGLQRNPVFDPGKGLKLLSDLMTQDQSYQLCEVGQTG